MKKTENGTENPTEKVSTPKSTTGRENPVEEETEEGSFDLE